MSLNRQTHQVVRRIEQADRTMEWVNQPLSTGVLIVGDSMVQSKFEKDRNTGLLLEEVHY